MPKTDFLKTWVVTDHEPSDVPEDGSFNIYDDGDDKVVIQYNDFGSTYPSMQNGTHDTGPDEIVAMFSEDHWIRLTFGNNYDELVLFVEDASSGSSYRICCPELGEWGAEACPSG